MNRRNNEYDKRKKKTEDKEKHKKKIIQMQMLIVDLSTLERFKEEAMFIHPFENS